LLCESSTVFADSREIEPGSINAAANLPTR
jgi:hypothetical protein